MMHATIFENLADPSRRRIVEALRGGERAVNDLVEAVAIDQSGVSRHLRILHGAGFVTMRPDGPRRLYSLRPEPFRELEAWAAGYRQLWEARLDRFGEALARKQAARAAPAGAAGQAKAGASGSAKASGARGRGAKGNAKHPEKTR